MIINKVIGTQGSGASASILATGQAASTDTVHTCTTPSGTVLQGTWDNGWLFDNLTEYGSYTLTMSNGSKTKSYTVLVYSASEFEVNVQYVTIIPVTITGTGSSTRAYVLYNSAQYYSAASFTYNSSVASYMTCKGYRSTSYPYGVYLNGTRVATTGTYKYTPTEGTTSISIALTGQTTTGYTVRITEVSST